MLAQAETPAVPARRGHARRRGAAPALPLPRPAARADAARARAAPPRHAGDPRPPGRGRVPRDRDADPDAVDARGRTRLRRAGRMQRGTFYALPQSPQLFKQLLMIAGYERYYQIARCFRDEELRADRQLEFTQLDMEMSFVARGGRDGGHGGRHARRLRGRRGGAGDARSRACRYDEAIARFGTDRPDLRFGLEIRDLGDALRRHRVQGLPRRARGRRVVRGINAGRARAVPRGARQADRVRPGPGRGRPGVGVRRGGRAAGGLRWRSSSPSRSCARSRPRSRRRPATCCCWSPTTPASRPRRSARCGSSWRGASA